MKVIAGHLGADEGVVVRQLEAAKKLKLKVQKAWSPFRRFFMI